MFHQLGCEIKFFSSKWPCWRNSIRRAGSLTSFDFFAYWSCKFSWNLPSENISESYQKNSREIYETCKFKKKL